MPEPLPAAATTGSHTDMPGGRVVISITSQHRVEAARATEAPMTGGKS